MKDIIRPVRVGLIKAVPEKWNVESNWSLFEMLARNAASRGARLICTSECFLDGYVAPDSHGFTRERFLGIAQALDDDRSYVGRARELAAELGVWMVFGFTERSGDGCYNAAALIDDSGAIVGCYRKTHLLDHDKAYLPGNDLPVYDTPFGKIGIMICADRRWPETARTLRVRGAELIMNPTYGMYHLDNEWWMRTRSYENEIFICFTHPNVSLITDPLGGIAARLESNLPHVLVHDIDLTENTDTMFSHRRPDIYDKS